MGVLGSKADLWGEDSGGPTCPPRQARLQWRMSTRAPASYPLALEPNHGDRQSGAGGQAECTVHMP